MPASDMMFEVRPMKYIGMKASSTETGIVTIGMIADGMCQRKTQDHDADDQHLLEQRVHAACRSTRSMSVERS